MTTPATQLPLPGTVAAGKYRVDAVLGRGGMGAVYRATHLLTGRTVALKWLLPDVAARPNARERFLREARAAARISHPNVVDVFDVVEDGADLFLVMEYLDGAALSERLDQGPLLPSELPTLFFPVLRAVIAAHARGVIHRDLKPDNVIVCRPEGSAPIVKVLDFGISKLVIDGEEAPALTRSGMAVGTPRYMSVEQLNGEREIDARTDVYALGVILYEALTGVAPFDGASYGAIAIQVATAVPKRPRELCAELPAELEGVVLKAMERNRDFRYRRVQDLLDALEQVLRTPGEARTESMPVPVQRPVTPPDSPGTSAQSSGVRAPEGTLPRFARAPEGALRPRRPGRRWRWLLAIAAVAVLVLAVLALRRPTAPHGTQAVAPEESVRAQPEAPAPPVTAEPEPGPVRSDSAELAPKPVEAARTRPHAEARAHTPRAAEAKKPDAPVPAEPPAPAPGEAEQPGILHRAGKLEREHF